VRKKFAPPKIEKCGNSWKRRKLGRPGPWRPWQVGLPCVFERIQCIVSPSKKLLVAGPRYWKLNKRSMLPSMWWP